MSPDTVWVDRERCEGHGLCVFTAPAVFDLDEDGYSSVVVDAIPADQMDGVLRAIASCPAGALAMRSAGLAADTAGPGADSPGAAAGTGAAHLDAAESSQA